MWPTLLSAGPITIHTFGVLLFLGLFFGGFRLWKNAKEEGWDETAVMDAWLMGGLGAIVGGRAAFILSNWPLFANNWYKMLFLTKFPGLSYEGAWLVGLAVLTVAGLRNKFPLWHWLETGVMAVLIVEIFGHLASFFAGNNLGQTTDFWWGLSFSGGEAKTWPVQLFWTAGLILIYFLLRFWERHYRSFQWYQNDKGEAREGFVAGSYLILTGLLKLLLAFISLSRPFGWGAAMAAAGALILIFRSGITMKVKLPANKKLKLEFKRKKKGFDYV